MVALLKRGSVFIWEKIAEPRTYRILQFIIYICLAVAGHAVLMNPPAAYQGVLGITLLNVFAWLLILGGVTGTIAVLPGIWWLERIGLALLFGGLIMFISVAFALGVSWTGCLIALALGCTFTQRWMGIRKFENAPRQN